MINFNNRFNTIKNISINIDEFKTFNFKIEQDKYTNDFAINIRQFI